MLSLDITAGAAASGAFACSVANADMRPGWWILLPLSVWVVYTADHLLDAWKTKGLSVNPRHKFHHDHMKVLLGCAAAAGLACAFLALFAIREVVLAGGLILTLIAALHLALARFSAFRFGKEISVAFIYTAGVWFGPILAAGKPSIYLYVFLTIFVLSALLNLVMNSVMESAMDEKEGMVYLLEFIPAARADVLVRRGSVVCTLASLLLFVSLREARRELPAAALVLALLCAVPGLILRFADRSSQLYRVAGEGVYLLGFLPWLVRILQ